MPMLSGALAIPATIPTRKPSVAPDVANAPAVPRPTRRWTTIPRNTGQLGPGEPQHVLVHPGLDARHVRHQDHEAPQSVDDAGHRGEQVHHVGDRVGDPARRVVRDAQRDADPHRNGEDHRDGRGDDRSGQQRGDAEDRRGVVRVPDLRGEEVALVRASAPVAFTTRKTAMAAMRSSSATPQARVRFLNNESARLTFALPPSGVMGGGSMPSVPPGPAGPPGSMAGLPSSSPPSQLGWIDPSSAEFTGSSPSSPRVPLGRPGRSGR